LYKCRGCWAFQMNADLREKGWADKLCEALVIFVGVILLLCLVCGFVALHVFIVLALNETNNDSVQAACGAVSRVAWGTLIAEILVTWGIVLAFVAVYYSDGFKRDRELQINCAGYAYLIFSIIVCVVGFAFKSALRRPACMDVLRAHSAGMDRALLVDLFDTFVYTHLGVVIVFLLSLCAMVF
jgi:heme/copper-type cytochrome/quinol oxidase subunit 2